MHEIFWAIVFKYLDLASFRLVDTPWLDCFLPFCFHLSSTLTKHQTKLSLSLTMMVFWLWSEYLITTQSTTSVALLYPTWAYMVLELVVTSKQERNCDASTLLGTLVDEIAWQEKISNEIEKFFDIYPTFYSREVRLFGKMMLDHLLGLLHHLKILKVTKYVLVNCW